GGWRGFGSNPHLAGGCNAAVKRPMIGITYPLDSGSRGSSRRPAADRRESFQLLIRHVKSPPEQPYCSIWVYRLFLPKPQNGKIHVRGFPLSSEPSCCPIPNAGSRIFHLNLRPN